MSDTKEKEVVSLSALIKEQKPKKEAPIMKYFFNKMTPEEYAAWKEKTNAKKRETAQRKKEEKEELERKAREMLPELLAHELLTEETSHPNWTPRQSTIDKLKALMTKNMTIETIRKKYFPSITDDTWHKLMKHMFRSSVQNVEDVGNEVFKARESAIKELQKSLTEVKQQIKIYKKEKGTKLIPAYLLDSKHKLISRISELTNDYALTLARTGAVGEKNKAPTLHLHMATPRPRKEEPSIETEAKDVTNLEESNGN